MNSSTDNNNLDSLPTPPPLPSTAKARVRLAKAADLNALWWLERTGNRDGEIPYATFSQYVCGKDPTRRALLLDLKGSPIGFCLFRHVSTKFVHALDLVIKEPYQKQGLGRRLLHVLGRLPAPFPQRAVVAAAVRESKLEYQKFLRSCGFICIGLIPHAFDCPPETAYHFLFEPPQEL